MDGFFSSLLQATIDRKFKMAATSNSSVLSTRDVRRTVLDNGLVVLTRESHRSPTVNSMIWYGVGSSDELPGHTGSSHFLEHMLFKGTERYGKGIIDRVTMKNGGSNNAFTSYDFTAYYFSFASDRWETAIDIEADRMVHTIFDPAEFEAEKNVVVDNRRYVTFQLAEVSVPRALFADTLRRIHWLGPRVAPA